MKAGAAAAEWRVIPAPPSHTELSRNQLYSLRDTAEPRATASCLTFVDARGGSDPAIFNGSHDGSRCAFDGDRSHTSIQLLGSVPAPMTHDPLRRPSHPPHLVQGPPLNDRQPLLGAVGGGVGGC